MIASRNAIWSMSAVTVISSIPLIFTDDKFNEAPIDIYPFADHARYAENIAYDTAELLTIILLTYTIVSLIRFKKYKRYAKCFLWISLLVIPLYFLTYAQYNSLILPPLLMIMLIYAYFRNRNEERNNFG
jgi:hypothetical protein